MVGSVAPNEVWSMQATHDDAGRQDSARSELLAELRIWQRQLRLRSLEEAIRLIASDKIEKLTNQHIRCIAEYDAITIDGESFFDKAFSSGKEVAACLGYAMEIGWQEVLEDMVRLHRVLSGRLGHGYPEPGCSLE
jgi:hypothetical protein